MNIFPDILLTTDAHQYGILAQNLINGKGFTLGGLPELIFPPGYSILLIPFLFFFDPNRAVLLLMYLGFLSLVVGMFLLTKKYTNGKIATIAALALLLNGNVIYYILLGYAEILMFAALLLSFYFFEQENKKKLFLSGALLGLAYLIKSEAILYMGVFICLRLFTKSLTLNRNFIYFAIPLLICIFGYSVYLYQHTGEIALSGKLAVLEWDRYIEDHSIDRHSIIYRLYPDWTLGPSLKNYSLAGIDFYKRGLINITAMKQAVFELLLPLKIILPILVLSLMVWKQYWKLFLAIAIINIPIAVTLLLHIENRYLFSILISIIFLLSVSAGNLPVVNLKKNLLKTLTSLSAFAGLFLLTNNSYLPLRADLPGLIEQQKENLEFLKNNPVENDIIISRKPVHSFLAGKDYSPLPYTRDPGVLTAFLDRYPNATIILDRWDFYTLPQVHSLIKNDYHSSQKQMVKDKQVLIFENWEK